MSQLDEAKQFVRLHAAHMGFGGDLVQQLLDGIHTLDGEDPSSWVATWSGLAEMKAAQGDHLIAANLYNLARFPHADSPAKRLAAERAAASARTLLNSTGEGETRTAELDGERIRFLFSAGPAADAPLVIVMGGIVSLKEQWYGLISLIQKAGGAVALADFPGVGESSPPYTRAAARVFSTVIDATADSCDSDRTMIIAPSFGGHLALLRSLSEPRIQRIFTIGAPLSSFFTGGTDGGSVPQITLAALRGATMSTEAELPAHLSELALDDVEISALTTDVDYVASVRDEIVPVEEWRRLGELTENAQIHTFDDVHGAPNHQEQVGELLNCALSRHISGGP